jgi:hypothetical protein
VVCVSVALCSSTLTFQSPATRGALRRFFFRRCPAERGEPRRPGLSTDRPRGIDDERRHYPYKSAIALTLPCRPNSAAPQRCGQDLMGCAVVSGSQPDGRRSTLLPAWDSKRLELSRA